MAALYTPSRGRQPGPSDPARAALFRHRRRTVTGSARRCSAAGAPDTVPAHIEV
ncbi:hypothetical protein [Streptomyces sp. NPDC051776]|uniref:hypothetical protein n=1 Tax=Streptomyces sp. NPDC051776 TaxID=3155414 RepID=UPI003425DE46